MEQTIVRGVFYGVGVGPGDPELMTLKAVRILEKCRVIAAPETAGGEMLALSIASQTVSMKNKEILPLRFSMSRDPEIRQAAHAAAAACVRKYLDAGQDVAMLSLGDVSIYSTCCYLMERLREEGYRTEMIAGVPSFCAVAARLGKSLTGMNTEIHILPAGDEKPLEESLRLPGTKILMKSGRQLPAAAEKLRREGLLADSSMVVRCGLPGEQVYASMEDFPAGQDAGYFATVIVKG